LTALNAVADETRIDESPTAAAQTCTSAPTAIPSAETKPASRPRSMLCETM
jgi:hypothetical protein